MSDTASWRNSHAMRATRVRAGALSPTARFQVFVALRPPAAGAPGLSLRIRVPQLDCRPHCRPADAHTHAGSTSLLPRPPSGRAQNSLPPPPAFGNLFWLPLQSTPPSMTDLRSCILYRPLLPTGNATLAKLRADGLGLLKPVAVHSVGRSPKVINYRCHS